MTPAVASVLARCALSGVTLEAGGGRLNYEARRGLPDDLRRELVGHKAEIMSELEWLGLSAVRWGPGPDDPTPGIVIARPDWARRRCAGVANAARGLESDVNGHDGGPAR